MQFHESLYERQTDAKASLSTAVRQGLDASKWLEDLL
jgi:hypothetical protein